MKPQIKEAYIDTGKVRFEFRHFPNLGAASTPAANASACAHAQGKFWEYHDHLYGPGRNILSGAQSQLRPNLIAAARNLGLDTEAFTECLTNETYAADVINDFRVARDMRIVGTPTFIINGRPIVGAHPFALWSQLFELLLAEMGS